MTSVLNTSTSALLAFQRALSTVSHNVANINTDGYSRQTTVFTTADGSRSGSTFIGTGTRIAEVRRVADQLAVTRLIDSNAEVARLQALSSLSDRIDTLLSDRGTNLEGGWSAFFDAVSGLSADAASASQRQNTLDTARSLVERFNRLDGQLENLSQEVNNGLASAAGEINRLAGQIAQLNRQVSANPDRVPADLLDRRDSLANELVSLTGGTITLQQDGSMNILTGGGVALVTGSIAARVDVATDPFQPERLGLVLTSRNLQIELGAAGLGGSVGGMLEFRSQVLDPLQSELGRIALGLAHAFNAQQAAGVDQYGERGQDLFAIGSASALPAARNGGDARLDLGIDDVTALTGQNVRLYFNGEQWQATDARTGEAMPLSGSGSADDPFLVAGMRVTLAGSPAKGDQFLLRPTAGLAGSLSVAISDPARLAAAAPVQAASALANTGSGRPGSLRITDAGNPDLATPVTVTFLDGSRYTLDGAGPFPYVPGSTIAANGWSFQLDGQPAAGDSFTVSPTPAGSSDNGNALLLAAVEDLRLFTSGTQSLTDVMAGLTTRAGSAARSAGYSLEAATVIQQQAQDSRDVVSGVNLDEEAAQMLRLQQAYQAASQMVATADSMFQTLLGVVSR